MRSRKLRIENVEEDNGFSLYWKSQVTIGYD
jgi:hypothetical protein